jgi:hypothetical protein
MELRILVLFALAALIACGDTATPFFYAPDAITLEDTDTAEEPDTSASDLLVDSIADSDSEDTSEPDGERDALEPDIPEADAMEPDAPEPDAPESDVPESDVSVGPACNGDFFDGQAYERPDAPAWSSNGGSRADTPYPASYDSGLSVVIATAPFDPDPTDVESPLPVPIYAEIVDATVFATAPNTATYANAQRSFWLHDGRASIQVFLGDAPPESWPAFDIHVGQRISFVATMVGSYRGVPQIHEASTWRVSSSGNAVAFREIGDEAMTFGDVPDNVRVTGEIVATLGPCGASSTCYEFVYGSQSITFRTAADWIDVGDCVAWAGPISTFDGLPNLDGSNYHWFYDIEPLP